MSGGSVSLSAKRAEAAYDHVQRWRRHREFGKISKRLQGLPVEVRQVGLTTAVAVLLREEQVSVEIADALAEWILKKCAQTTLPRGKSAPTRESLLAAAVKAPRPAYVAAQSESIAFLESLKLMASAVEKSGPAPSPGTRGERA